MSEIVHLAFGNYTICATHIVGSTIECMADEKERVYAGIGTNIQHTCIPENVTCVKCLDSKAFKDYVKTLEEEYD